MITRQKRQAFFDLVKEAKSHLQPMVLWPARWKEYKSSASLRWKSNRFDNAVRGHVPNEPGVYAFLIKPRIANLDVSYLMYIGKTDRSLRRRFDEYLADVRDFKGRPAIAVLLHNYQGFVDFSCATLSSPQRPGVLENKLLEAFIPPANKQLPAKISRIISAFR
jgi:excinuclease UvrABC nuclease subunit